MFRLCVALFLPILLVACQGDSDTENTEAPVRGLKTILIEEVEQTITRRYPSVLQPASITTLSFEVAGRLQEVNLDVGQILKEADVLVEIDPTSLELQVESARASLNEARSVAKNAAADLARKEELLEKQIISEAEADKSRTDAETSAARVAQAERSLQTAEENLGKSKLVAPFDGIINSVEVQSFSNVGAGTPVATMYATEAFETSFSVSFDVVNRLAVGKKVKVRLADSPDVVLAGHISELGARADTVSSFPVVVKLDETDRSIKAGMAVEISIEFSLPSGEGFTLPLSVLPFDGVLDASKDPSDPGKTQVFVYNSEDSTVSRRDVLVGGVRENSIIIIEGLELGERVASAGVSFLKEGQKVKLLADTK